MTACYPDCWKVYDKSIANGTELTDHKKGKLFFWAVEVGHNTEP